MIGLLWVIAGIIIGATIVYFLTLRNNPWKWAMLLNKIKRKPHMVAVLVDKGVPGIPVVLEMGTPIKFFNDERLWVFTGDNILELAPDGEIINQHNANIYKLNGVPTVFFSLRDMRPLKLEGHGKDIPPEDVGPLIERYISIRMAQAMLSVRHIDLRTLLIMVGVAIAMIASLWALIDTFQIMADLQTIKATLTSIQSNVFPPPPIADTNAVVIS